jgi:hypothetical protein
VYGLQAIQETGSSWENRLPDELSRTGALAEAMRFNALAASGQPGAASGPAEGSGEDAHLVITGRLRARDH